METQDNGDWYSITHALDRLDVSRRTLYDRINRKELTTKKVGRNRFVWLDGDTDVFKETYRDTTTRQKGNIVKELKEQVEYFKSKVEKLETDLRDTNQRHDATIFQMVQQNQLLLEQGRKPFWKFW